METRGTDPSTPLPEKTPEKTPEKKLFVASDDDWKAKAQEEKQRLAKKADEEKAKTREPRPLPVPTFAAFVGDLGLQALLALGLVQPEKPSESDEKADLPAARYLIDLLGLLEEKTRGNLSPEEKRQLSELLASLRLQYVRLSKVAATPPPA